MRIDDIIDRCRGAYAPRTLSGYRADLKVFQTWCDDHAQSWLPASPEAIACFIDAQIPHHRISTIKRRICGVVFAHRVCDLPNPTEHSTVHLALRRATRAKAQRPEQAGALTARILKKILDHPATTLADLRDAALVSVGYDTLCRSSEIAAMEVAHFSADISGAMRLLVPHSKADISGNGRVTHLSPKTAERLNRWLDAAEIRQGPLFQGLHLGRPSGQPLKTSSIRRIVKRSALRAGIDGVVVQRLSGHSMRIGAAQDMMVEGFDILAIMQAGGWKKPDIALRYVENAATRRLHERRWASIFG